MANKRPFYAITRIQGVALMAVGIGMLFIPETSEHAGTVIAAGIGWAGGGVNAKATRKE